MPRHSPHASAARGSASTGSHATRVPRTPHRNRLQQRGGYRRRTTSTMCAGEREYPFRVQHSPVVCGARMPARRSAVSIIVQLVCVLMSGCHATARERLARRAVAWPTTLAGVSLEPQASLAVETRNLSSHALTALSLWDVAAQREVAYAAGSRWFGRGSQLRYRNESPQLRSYRLLVHAVDDAGRGTADVYRDGRLWLPAVAVGGTLLRMRSGPDIVHQVAAAPGGPRAALLVALDRRGHVIGLDETSGPTGLPKLPGRAGIDSLLLASREARRGPLHVYSNDALDRDGDGLGRRLERAIETCDSPEQPGCARSQLSAYYRQVGTRDTDRDGISDGDELLGVSAPALDLPRFGADPRHKDVFVEVDHDKQLQTVGFSESELAEIAALFEQGSAAVLRNPDGKRGVHVHFDAGFAPAEPVHHALLGDFGGSGQSAAPQYRAARKRDFTAGREGYFRYAFSTRKGRGQAHGDAFTVNRDLARVTIFAHELGHTLGLAHHGHDSWGRFNCKPNYLSIMNYLYQQRYEVGFSRHAGPALNPAFVLERRAATGTSARFLRDAPLELDVLGAHVDWNRDGTLSDGYVRADLTWGTYKSCGAAEFGITTLAEHAVAAATPVLLRLGDGLYALWLDTSGQIWWRRAAGTLAATQERDRAAAAWSPARSLPARAGIRHIAALALPDGSGVLACVREDAAVELVTLTASADGLQPSAAAPLGAVRTQHAPSLVLRAVDEAVYGAKQLLQIILREAGPDGALVVASAESAAGRFVLRRITDIHGQPLATALAPSFVSLPTGETCGVLTDHEAFMRFVCFDAVSDNLRDLSSQAFDVGLGPRTAGQVGLAYHVHRKADGEPIAGDPSRGALYLTFTEPAAPSTPPDNPHVLVSEGLSAARRAETHSALRWRGSVINEWVALAPGTGVALLEDPHEPGLRGLMAVRDAAHDSVHLDFLPHADGEFAAPLRSGDDFAVMERGICLGLHNAAVCGDETTAGY